MKNKWYTFNFKNNPPVTLILFLGVSLLIQACSSGMKTRQPVIRKSRIPLIRVLLSESHFIHIEFQGEYLLWAPEAKYKISGKMGAFWAAYEDGLWSFASTQRKWHFKSGFPLSITPIGKDNYIYIDGKKVKGTLRIHSVSEKTVQYILETDLETYLTGVVPAEIPTGNPDYYEAVKAQAIAARSYAYKKFHEADHRLFHLYDDQRDQVLGQMTDINDLAKKAVANTSGIILDGQNPAFIPYYHSTCGGVFSPYDTGNYDGLSFDASSPDSVAYCSISPLYRWHKTLSVNNIVENLVKRHLLTDTLNFDEYDHELHVSVGARNGTGRVENVTVRMDQNDWILKNYEIRRTLLDSTGGQLPSNWFFVSPTSSDSMEMLVVGAGFGHGKGMCQWGAIAMSLKGFTFESILKHYYPGAILKRIYR